MKNEMVGFCSFWVRLMSAHQKTIQLPSSRQDGGKGIHSPEYKHSHRFVQRMNKTGGIPRGNVYPRMFRLGYRSESRLDLTRSTQ
ncbi:hypothetical protein CBF16_21500 (plasmid) [Pantoea agglomerans]|uniref:hypothetical protein n=1 Tax=Enterobacter agglomerans TaxID=549 RepID=UPI000F5D866E|nr:hypothetical protein [Pantoea agglomerans]AZI53421.1 hypothetical protein CBF16_21500 [Pantoea agglomerans]